MDSDPSASPIIIGIIASYFLSAFFSMVKIIFSSIDRTSLAADDERLRYYASKIEDVLEDKIFLNAMVSFGKTLANVIFAILAFSIVRSTYVELPWLSSFLIAFAATTAFLSVFAYAIPRAFALRFFQPLVPLAFMTYSALNALFYVFSVSIIGVHRLFLKIFNYDERYAFLSEEEKSRLNEYADEEQRLDENEKEMIHSIFELGDTTVREIMTPRVDIKALETQSNLEKALNTIKEVGHSRIPVFHENIDSIAGVLYARDVLTWLTEHKDEQWDLEKLLREPHFVPVGKMIDDLMAEFKKKQIHMAIVVDEYGGTAGIVTLEDILEEIVGEIHDEYDVEEEPIIEVGPDTYHVDPHLDLHDLCEEIDINLDLEDVEYNTLGGLIYHEYGDIPEKNTELEYDGLHLKVLEMDGQRIEKVQVEVRREKNSPSENGH